MPDITLLNTATMTGTYGILPAVLTSLPVSTELVTGLSIVKTADKEVWVDGYLTYTITIVNDAEESLSNLVVTDLLDILKITLVTNSVEVNDTPSTYTYIDGLLSVSVPEIAPEEEAVITFQVQKI